VAVVGPAAMKDGRGATRCVRWMGKEKGRTCRVMRPTHLDEQTRESSLNLLTFFCWGYQKPEGRTKRAEREKCQR
jgi:hypothetical protein